MLGNGPVRFGGGPRGKGPEHQEPRRAAYPVIQLGGYDERIVGWLAGWDVPVVAAVVSLLWRARHAAAGQARRGGGEPR